MFNGRLTDEITLQTLQTQGTNWREWRVGRSRHSRRLGFIHDLVSVLPLQCLEVVLAQKSQGEILHPRDDIVSLLVGRGLPEHLARRGEFLENYGVPTKRLNEQVKRNIERFPDDFMFRLNREEAKVVLRSRSQIATLKRGQNIKYLPYAFTENGAIMSANNVPRADVLRRFVRSWTNFQRCYRPPANVWTVYDNSSETPRLLEQGP